MLAMSKELSTEDWCRECCCFCSPCCFPQEKIVVCDVYQPVVPSEKIFGYPQEEVQISHPPSRKPARKSAVVTSQPAKRAGTTAIPKNIHFQGLESLESPHHEINRPQRSRSIDEGTKEKPWRVLSSPVRSRAVLAKTLPSHSLQLTGTSSQVKVVRSLSHACDQSKHSASAGPSITSHTVASDTESDNTEVFKWNRSKSTDYDKTFSFSITCPTPRSVSLRKKKAALEFNLYYDGFRESLNVHIHRGLYLPQRRGHKTIDSFVQAHLKPSRKQILKTSVIFNSRSPAFDQLLEFSDLTFEEFREQTLVLQVYYRMYEKSDKLICSCSTKLEELDLNTNNPLIKTLDEGVVELRKKATYKEIEEMLTPEAIKEALLSFTLYYDNEDRRLLVYLGGIVNVPTSLPPAASNPYVQIYLLPSIHVEHKSRHASFRRVQQRAYQRSSVYTTQVIQQSHQPNFECTASFSGVKLEELASRELVFRVYVNGETHFVGGVFYPVPSQHSFGETITTQIRRFPEEEGLKEDFLGDILLSLCHQPEKNTITVTIVEMKLKKCPAHEHISPYVRVDLMCGEERLSKWKTSVRRLDPNPIYKEVGELELIKECDDVELHVLIKKSDYLTQQNVVGLIKLGQDVGRYRTGRSQWIEAMATPNKTITTWHPIFPPPPVSPSQLAPMGSLRSSFRSRSRSRSPSPSQSGRLKVLKPMIGMQL